MKILIISKDFPKIKGGVSDYTYYLFNELKKKSECYVLTRKDERIIKEKNVLPLILNFGFKGIWEIIKEINKIKPSWIIFQYVPYMYSYIGVPFWLIFLYLILKIKKYKICTMFHEIRIVVDLSKPKYILIAIFQKIIAFFLSFLSDKIIVSIEFYKRLIKIFEKKIKVIPVGSNVVPESEDLKEENKKYGDEIIIGYFGGANKGRRIDIHLKAVKILKEKGINVKYIFIGEAPSYYKKLAKKLNIDAEFTGYLEKEKVYEYLKNLDFFIFFEKYSNKYEAGINLKSGAIAAAFSANVPIISNKGILTDKILKGYYINSKPNENEIGEKILKFIKDKEKIKRLKGKIKNFYENYLKWEKISKEYIDYLK